MKKRFDGLLEFLNSYCNEGFLRLHVPGHQGRCRFLNRNLAAKFDITEVEGADWLFGCCGVLQKLEQELNCLFRRSTAISTCGSTLCVQTMVALCRNRIFIAYRNSAHVSFFNACAILGAKVVWVGQNSSFEFDCFDLNELEKVLVKYEKGSCAIYLTSPDYFGFMAPVEQILEVCRKFKALCLVDCAHGAHLNLVKSNSHPASLGVDLCCSSLHKTLPTLTGAAVLNFNESLFSRARVKATMSMFSTTSPSYLTMASIDFCVSWWKKRGGFDFFKLARKKQNLVKNLELPILKTDVTKLVVDCRKINLTGLQLAEMLRLKKIEPEFASENFVVMVLSPFLRNFDWLRLKKFLERLNFEFLSLEPGESSLEQNFRLSGGLCELKPAFVFGEKGTTQRINLSEQAMGRVCAETKFKSPPGTVAVFAGEVLQASTVLQLKNMGEEQIEVLK